MKYPIGTKIKVIDAQLGARGCNDTIAVIVKKNEIKPRGIPYFKNMEKTIYIQIIEKGKHTPLAEIGEIWNIGTESIIERIKNKSNTRKIFW